MADAGPRPDRDLRNARYPMEMTDSHFVPQNQSVGINVAESDANVLSNLVAKDFAIKPNFNGVRQQHRHNGQRSAKPF